MTLKWILISMIAAATSIGGFSTWRFMEAREFS